MNNQLNSKKKRSPFPKKELLAIITLVFMNLKEHPYQAIGFGLVAVGLILLFRYP